MPRSGERPKRPETRGDDRTSSAGQASLVAIERALENVVGRLASPNPTPLSRELLIEARRLKSLVGSWHSIPPPDEARREMLSRVSRLTARVPAPGADVYTSRPPRDSDRVRSAPPTAAELAATEPPPSFGDRAISESGGPIVLRTRMMAWRPLRGAEGIDVKVIRKDGTRQTIAVLRMDVGTEVPTGALGRSAEIYVVSGDVAIDVTQLHRGDVWSSTDAVPTSAVLRTATGAELLVMGWDDSAAWLT